MDALQEAPMDLGMIPEGSDWLNVVRPLIQAQIQKYSEGEIHFNLMAVVADKRIKLQRRLETEKRFAIKAKVIIALIVDDSQCFIFCFSLY